ncbi:MAG TPA: hypothetical protein VJN18_14455 [Polyangiaceae bacterium]|nr:hypothetical protein [Polyangiaceae bacterium]
MLSVVKRMVGLDRDAPATPKLDREALERPVEAARQALDAAAEKHTQSLEYLAAADQVVADAQAVFDADRSDANADALTRAKAAQERRSLFAESTGRAGEAAQQTLLTAEQTRDAAIRAHLQERISSAEERVQALWDAKGRPAAEALATFTDELDVLLDDAREAIRDAYPGDADKQHAKVMQLNAQRSLVRQYAKRDIGPAALVRIERIVD